MMKKISLHIRATEKYYTGVKTLLLNIGTVQGSTDICPNYTAQISLFVVIPSSLSNKQLLPCNSDNTSLSTNFGAKASEHQTLFITSTS